MQRKSNSVTIGYNDYYLRIDNIFLAVHKKPNLFHRMMLKLLTGITFVTNEERDKLDAEDLNGKH